MQLLSLKVKEYKNLKNLEFPFKKGEGLSIIIGNNGSGKSNVLELISGIFHDVYKNKAQRKIDTDYTLIYKMNDIECKIENKNGRLLCYAPKNMSKSIFISRYVPKRIIGLYSGEEDRLWTEYYESYYKSYISDLKNNAIINPMKLMFINKYYWNIALLTILLSENTTLKEFVKKELGIFKVDKIKFTFNTSEYNNSNELIKSFIDRINEDHNDEISYALDELKNNIFFNYLTNEKGYILTDEGDRILVVDSGITDVEVFRNFVQTHLPKKDKIIKNIQIVVNDGISLESLSEGEKKLILVKAVLEILADEQTIVLMDEPDAHIHEGRKENLYNMIKEYPVGTRQIIVSTHSPIIAQLAKDNELIMLECENNKTSVVSSEKIDKLKKLTGDTWDVISQSVLLNSNKPLVVMEGKTDVLFVKKAIEMLKDKYPQYKKINVDFINGNGSGNIKSFIANFKEFSTLERKIFAIYDRDSGGRGGASSFDGINVSRTDLRDLSDYVTNDGVTISFLPYTLDVESGEFLIEDYFNSFTTIKTIIDDITKNISGLVKNFPNLASSVKSELEKRVNNFTVEEFEGFTVLLDKILELTQEETDEQ